MNQEIIFDEDGLRTLDEGVNFDNFVELLRYRCEHHPKRIALNFLVDGELDNQIGLSYQKLNQQVIAIANKLKQSFEPQSRILILCPAGNEFILAFVACLYARMIAVPCVLPNRRERDWQKTFAISDDCKVSAVVTTNKYHNEYQEKFTDRKYPVIDVNGINTGPDNQFDFPKIGVEDIAFLQYTSGSTGDPKGIMVSHRNLMHNQRVLQTGFTNSGSTRMVSWLPLFHDMGLIGCALQSLYLGISFNYMSPIAFLQKPIRWLQAISYFKATTSGAPNFAYELCVSRVTESQLEELDLSSWQCAFNGAEPVRSSTIEKFYKTFSKSGLSKTAQSPVYGLAEGTLMVTSRHSLTEPNYRRLDTRQLEQGNVVNAPSDNPNCHTYVGVGSIVGNQVMRVVNPDTKNLSLIDQVGEIWVKGPSIAEGYWNREEQSREDCQAYIENTNEGPFLRTGDAGFVDQSGELFISARLKDMIILSGRNIYPQDIELVAETCYPGLRLGGSAAFGLLSDNDEKLVVLQEVQRTALKTIDLELAIQSIRQAIATEFQLAVYDVVLLKPGSLLKTSSGKVQRRANRDAYTSQNISILANCHSSIALSQEQQETVENVTDQGVNPKYYSQEEIIDWVINWLIQQYPDTENINQNNLFIDTGLTSVAGVELCHQLSTQMGPTIEPIQIWQNPSICGFASYVESLQHASAVPTLKNTDTLEGDKLTSDKKREGFSPLPTKGMQNEHLDSLSMEELTELISLELD